jgi:hypothetical protein
MKVRRKIFVGIAALAMSGLAYCLTGEVDAVMLRRHAESSCRCEQQRGPGARQACWADFEKEFAAKHPQIGDHHFCEVFIHPDNFVWTVNGWKHRITTRYTMGMLPGGPVTLCSEAEATAAETAVSRDWERDGTITPATEKLVRDIARGRPYTPEPADTPSCA